MRGTAEGVEALGRLGLKSLNSGSKLVGFIGKLGPFSSPLTVIVAIGTGATVAQAAEAGARDLMGAALVEGTMRVVVMDGGSILSASYSL